MHNLEDSVYVLAETFSYNLNLYSILVLPLVISLLAIDARMVGASPRVIIVDDDGVERPMQILPPQL